MLTLLSVGAGVVCTAIGLYVKQFAERRLFEMALLYKKPHLRRALAMSYLLPF